MASILVIGAGTMGLATACALLDRGHTECHLLDRRCPPHDSGSHHGQTRLLRIAYGEGAGYVQLAKRAHALWQILDRESDTRLFDPCGVLNIGTDDDPFIHQVEASARRFSLAVSSIDGTTTARRWPGWSQEPGQRGCFEAAAGVLMADRIMDRWRQRIETSPAVSLHSDADIAGLSCRADGRFQVTARDGRAWCADRVLLSAGQHVATLAGQLGLDLPLQRVRKVFAWFDADERYQPSRFPGFSFIGEAGDFYGFPDIDGAGVKIGRHDGGQPVAPDQPLAPFGAYSADIADLRALADQHLPGVGGLKQGAVCEYIRTPDEDFLIDEPLPGLIVAGGFSGHGFKFAPAIGERLADWLCTGTAPAALTQFRAGRFH